MSDVFNVLASDGELQLRMQNLAFINNRKLGKHPLDIGLKFQRSLRQGVETPIRNDDLETFLGYGITQAQKYLSKLEESGIISVDIKSCPKAGKNIPHYTLAKLPELTLEQIDYLINKENEDLLPVLNTSKNNIPLQDYLQIKKSFQEYEDRIHRLLFLKLQHLEIPFITSNIESVHKALDISNQEVTNEYHI